MGLIFAKKKKTAEEVSQDTKKSSESKAPDSGKSLVVTKKPDEKLDYDLKSNVTTNRRVSNIKTLVPANTPKETDEVKKPKEKPISALMNVIALAVLLLVSLMSVAISSASFVNVSNFAVSSKLNETLQKGNKGYAYGKVVQDNVVFDFSEFKRGANLWSEDLLLFSETFFHSESTEEFQPLVTFDWRYSEQLAPDVVMTYDNLTDNYYNFSLISGKPIEQIWTSDVYITQPLADEILAVDPYARADFKAKEEAGENGYLIFDDYRITAHTYYYEEWDRYVDVKGVISTESLGRFADINGGSFIYCSYDATTWCFGKPALEFFLFGNEVSMTNYFHSLDKGMARYDEGTFSLEFYSWKNGEFALDDLTEQYVATKFYYSNAERYKEGAIFAALAMISFIVFVILSIYTLSNHKIFLDLGPYMPILIFSIAALVLAGLLLIPDFVVNGVIFSYGNYASITYTFALGFIASFFIAIVSSVVIRKDKRRKEKATLARGDDES